MDYINGTYLDDKVVAAVKPIQQSPIVLLVINLITNMYYSAFCIIVHIYNAVLILRTTLR